MTQDAGNRTDEGRRITVTIRRDVVETLEEFCREKHVAADRVVERALMEYFREGDMSH